MSIVMVHSNPLRIHSGRLTVDRKFHVGMLKYVDCLGPVTTVNPALSDGVAIMDPVEIPSSEAPYNVISATDWDGAAAQVSKASLVYGIGEHTARLARALHVPFIQILEYDLDTQLRIIGAETSGLRRVVRSARCARHYYSASVPDMRAAHGLHCNGFPMFEASAPHNENRLLYFDSRMRTEDVIPEDQLEDRLATLHARPMRLIYSGRYERMKGADDAVCAAVECLQRGLRIEFDCYGQGTLKERMIELSRGYPSIRVHDAIPYPELVRASRSADLFVCCHIQSDPSCTYLEAMGSGLPIIGYPNRMWTPLQAASGAGLVARRKNVSALADLIEGLMRDRTEISRLSLNARTFALQHSFEREFDKRVTALKAAIN